MKKFLKKVVFYGVMMIILPLYGVGMLLLFIASIVTGTMCDWMED